VERIERDADRQHDVELGRRVDHADGGERLRETVERERAVLEIAEYDEVDEQRRDDPALARSRCLRSVDAQRDPPVERRRRDQQEQERRIPRGIERVAGDEQEILARAPAGQCVVSGQNDREEDQERERVELHRSALRDNEKRRLASRRFRGSASWWARQGSNL